MKVQNYYFDLSSKASQNIFYNTALSNSGLKKIKPSKMQQSPSLDISTLLFDHIFKVVPQLKYIHICTPNICMFRDRDLHQGLHS